MGGLILFEILYIVLVILVVLRVLYDSRSSSKALAYILFIVLVPLIGMLFYFSFGVNYRKRKLYSKKIIKDKVLRNEIDSRIKSYSEQVSKSGLLGDEYLNISRFIFNSAGSPPTGNNAVKLLVNGEQKFPELLRALRDAKSHIHLEYYIYENDTTGNAIADILIEKAREGLEVRFMYDDFGSHSLGAKFIKRLEAGGVLTAPFYKIKWYALGNRINYRNHRKIVVIDGVRSFVGGINISDKYRNDGKSESDLYWRDTHLMIDGPATFYLQHIFLSDWNFCSREKIEFDTVYFPVHSGTDRVSRELVQLVPSGPDSALPLIFYSLMDAIGTAQSRIRITSPYFIPGESLMDALIIAAKSGVEVEILVPGISDSRMVNSAARSYYTELLPHGVRIFTYNKGFVHAKTMVIDDELAVVGSANMDYRSFDLNFEINAMLYGKELNAQLSAAFENDLKHSTEIIAADWLHRPKYISLWEKMVRLLSPFL